MSVRLDPSRVLPDLPGTVFDTLVVFTGWEANNLVMYGTPVNREPEKISAVDVMLDAERSSPAGSMLFTFGMYGILGSSPTDVCPLPDNVSLTPLMASTLIMAWNFIETHFDPRGKLIIHGNSAGGDCALNLCRAISRCKQWYFFADPMNRRFGSDASNSDVLGQTCVDLLITADAAIGPPSDIMDRSLPPCVMYNENYYQLNSFWSKAAKAHGAPNVPDDPASTTVSNEDFTTRADHMSMGSITRPQAVAAINKCRGI